ncbi:MAG: tetratricopeptide repeat protein, partial [Ignavibacteria bacterium]|nr:tetratricopeptide repeat protein [Ignavibacteria bacterium]
MIRAILVVLMLSNFLYANEFETYLQKGNEAYKNKDYKTEIENYTKVLSSGIEGASIFYNIGNAHYRLGNLGEAIYYYEKALKLKPADEDITHNLQIAKLQTIDKLDELPKLFFVKWWESILSMFSLDGWTLISYFLYLSVLVIISLMMLVKNGKLQKLFFQII